MLAHFIRSTTERILLITTTIALLFTIGMVFLLTISIETMRAAAKAAKEIEKNEPIPEEFMPD